MEEKLKLIVTEKDEKGEEIKLVNEQNDIVTSFSIEYDKETCLISYDTKLPYRNKGYASYGLKLIKQKLFEEEEKLFLELINLSGDYSRKVAENAGFFSYSGNLDCFMTVNPNAEQILDKQLSLGLNVKSYSELLNKVQRRQAREDDYFMRMREKLDQLREQRDLVEDHIQYKEQIQLEINHIEKIFDCSSKKTNNSNLR